MHEQLTKMSRTVVVVLMGLAIAAQAQQHQEVSTDMVQALLAEVSDDNFDSHYVMEVYQQKVAEIRRDVPTFLQEKRIQELSASTNSTCFEKVDSRWADLRPLLIFKPITQILEIRPEGAYVKMTFNSPDRSPLAHPSFDGMAWGGEGDNRILKEGVFCLNIDANGRLMNVSRTEEVDVFWANGPFRIAAVYHSFSGYGLVLTMRIATVGSEPKANARIKIGSFVVDGKDIEKADQNLNISVSIPGSLIHQTDIPVIISATSESGETDNIAFTIPKIDGSQIYVRQPWLSGLAWNCGLRELRIDNRERMPFDETRYKQAQTETRQIGKFQDCDSDGNLTDGGVVVTDVSIKGTYVVGDPIFFMSLAEPPVKNAYLQPDYPMDFYLIEFSTGQEIAFNSEATRDDCFDVIMKAYQDWIAKFKDVRAMIIGKESASEGAKATPNNAGENANESTSLSAAQNLVGTWRDEVGLKTFRADGTEFAKDDNGHTFSAKWTINGDTLAVVVTKRNGRTLDRPETYRATITHIDASTYETKEIGNGREWHFTKVK